MTTFKRRAFVSAARVAPAAILVPVVPMVVDALGGIPGASAELHDRLPNVLGAATMLLLLASYAITPLSTVTGWRWHVILRRDFALWACAFAFSDVLAAAAADGVLAGTAGKLGLAAGTLATLLLVPLAVTSNRLSMRWLGRYWKQLHLLIYPIFALIVVHLYFVGSALFAGFFGAVVALLAMLRHRRVERWFVSRREAGRRS
ncbi:MAG: ferric reductase-like transmembrane domain-containing protein [Kibdelosporangium sp.]